MPERWRPEDARVKRERWMWNLLAASPVLVTGAIMLAISDENPGLDDAAAVAFFLTNAAYIWSRERIQKLARRKSVAHLSSGTPATISTYYRLEDGAQAQIGHDVGVLSRDGATLFFAGARTDARIANGDVSHRFISPESFEVRSKDDPDFTITVTLDLPPEEFDMFVDAWLDEKKVNGSSLPPRAVQRESRFQLFLLSIPLAFFVFMAALALSSFTQKPTAWIAWLFLTLASLISLAGVVFVLRSNKRENLLLDRAVRAIERATAKTG